MSKNYLALRLLKSLKIFGMPTDITDEDSGLIGFIPVFKTEEQAKAWVKSDDVLPLELGAKS